jgi:hypothetical protein
MFKSYLRFFFDQSDRRALYQIRVDYPLYFGKGRGAGGRGEKTPELEKGVIKADLVLPVASNPQIVAIENDYTKHKNQYDDKSDPFLHQI